MLSPRLPPSENFSGTDDPACTTLTTGRLSTGAKNPVHGHATVALFTVTDTERTVVPPSPSSAVTVTVNEPGAAQLCEPAQPGAVLPSPHDTVQVTTSAVPGSLTAVVRETDCPGATVTPA